MDRIVTTVQIDRAVVSITRDEERLLWIVYALDDTLSMGGIVDFPNVRRMAQSVYKLPRTRVDELLVALLDKGVIDLNVAQQASTEIRREGIPARYDEDRYWYYVSLGPFQRAELYFAEDALLLQR